MAHGGSQYYFRFDTDERGVKSGPEAGLRLIPRGVGQGQRVSETNDSEAAYLQSDISILPQVLTDGNITSVLLSGRLL